MTWEEVATGGAAASAGLGLYWLGRGVGAAWRKWINRPMPEAPKLSEWGEVVIAKMRGPVSLSKTGSTSIECGAKMAVTESGRAMVLADGKWLWMEELTPFDRCEIISEFKRIKTELIGEADRKRREKIAESLKEGL